MADPAKSSTPEMPLTVAEPTTAGAQGSRPLEVGSFRLVEYALVHQP
jgi:hypothetical protein